NFKAKQLWQTYSQGHYDQLSYILINQLKYYDNLINSSIDEGEEYNLTVQINQFLKHFLYFITQEDFIVSDDLTLAWLSCHGVLANLLSISGFRNAEPYLQILQSQQQNFLKLLLLYSANNQAQIAPSLLFDIHAQLACIWYANYLESWTSQLVNSKGYFNLRQHLRDQDERLTDLYAIENLYFGVTYIDADQEPLIKTNLNHKIQSHPLFKQLQEQLNQNLSNQNLLSQSSLDNQEIDDQRKNPQIAVISGCWSPGHSVHRNYAHYVDVLKKHFSVTLIHLGNPSVQIDQEGFSQVLNISWHEQNFDISELLKHQFSLIFFPDIGMSTESILLSNLRIAPIQVMGLGHPSSSWSQHIDYVITGRKVELPSVIKPAIKPPTKSSIKSPKNQSKSKHYSEKLILLPGLGVSASLHPRMANLNLGPSGFQASKLSINSDQKDESDPIIINCPWYPQKVNYPMLLILNRIRNEIKRPCIFRFFSGAGFKKLHQFLAFKHEIVQVLGAENCQVFPSLNFDDYATYLSQGHLTLDSHPFGGFNVVLDSLAVGIPTVVWEGKHWYNRAAAQCLRNIGLEVLIATNATEYISTVVNLVKSLEQNNQLYYDIKAKLTPEIITQINQGDDSNLFVAAFHHLIKHDLPKYYSDLNYSDLKLSQEKSQKG
ncbi:MAG: hypothetical protein ACK456_08370, partial [Pseudanabaenaceae cyanobacterium]